MFDELVLNTEEGSFDRLEGMLAYSKYKLKKNEFFKTYNEKHNKAPDDAAIYNFIITFNKREIKELKAGAGDSLVEFAQEYTEALTDQISEDIINASILQEVKDQNHWWSNLWQNVAASIVFSVTAFVLLLILVSAKEDWNISKIYQAVTDDSITLQINENNTADVKLDEKESTE
ncbi:MAG: hypothetical protein HRT92_10050 [Piscirickettsiaceae bacterium]|nr:hypothetical protein [Piscirickettsiaceae bacterium]